MLTVTITPGGRPLVVKIEEALFLLGLDIHRYTSYPNLTEEERHQRALDRRREYRQRRKDLLNQGAER